MVNIFVSAFVSFVVSLFMLKVSIYWFKRWIDDFFEKEEKVIKSQFEDFKNHIKESLRR
ncbi:hypothetical protein BN1356_00954 [Streptococcus varani]|uniref:Uncharacterized protein n=1 Tax=Streptococcus varani TaxID=1608583 RepID=A0A0E4CSG2_9STRE|nr:hypothetical protein [Streptococcus varani]CQR24610.1 hypothetical protein BN1356_00954 [Streptococcus varani]